jgi:hypothetical protein
VDTASKRSGTQDSQPDRADLHRTRHSYGDPACNAYSIVSWIFYENCVWPWPLLPEHPVGLGGLRDGQPSGGEGSQRHLASADQLQVRLHISSFRPADIGVGIVQPLFFVARVIPARSIRSGYQQIKLLRVHELAPGAEPHPPNHHHSPLPSGHPHCQMERLVTLCGRCEYDRI